MDYYELAKIIPSKFRSLILEKNHIYKAVRKFGDYDMMMLWYYWANFIEPNSPIYKYDIIDGKIVVQDQCMRCLSNLHDKWILLEPYIKALEVEKNLLKTLK